MGSRRTPLELTPQSTRALTERLAHVAAAEGLVYGIASPAQRPDASVLQAWLRAGHAAGLDYMQRHVALRLEPERFAPGTGSILCFAWNYHRRDPEPAPRGAPHRREDRGFRIASYAWGRDYHHSFKQKLHRLLRALQVVEHRLRGRVAVDTAPVLERHWAAASGLGWIGRNGCLIVPRIGSRVFLGEIFLNVAMPPGRRLAAACGECRRCIAACPGQALSLTAPLDARRCRSYWTVEHRGPFPEGNEMPPLDPWLFGCDVCQLVCPHNEAAPEADVGWAPEVPAALGWGAGAWRALGAEGFARLFGGTPLARTGYEGILRNLERICAERRRS